MRIWITRTQPAADRTATRLRAMGHDPLVAPVFTLVPLAQPPGALALDEVGALAFTSAAGATLFATLSGDRGRPVYAVGEATAAAARAAGWSDVRCADGDGAALAAMIAADKTRPPGLLLVPGPLEPAFDVPGALVAGGVPARALALYAARPFAEPPVAVRAALDPGAEAAPDALLLHSPAAGRTISAWARADAAFGLALRNVQVFALSAACATALDPSLGGARRVAEAPREADLLALLPQAPRLDSPPPRR